MSKQPLRVISLIFKDLYEYNENSMLVSTMFFKSNGVIR